MGSIVDNNKWEPAIYMVQKTDPFLGGDDGIVNIRPKQLANRTRFLLERFLIQHATETGLHSIKNSDVELAAGIEEQKLQLDYSTSLLYNKAGYGYATETDMYNELTSLIEGLGSEFSAYGKAVPLTWQYGEYGFAFELFTDVLSLRYQEPIEVTSTIAGSDTVQCSSSLSLSTGEDYVISDSSGNNTEIVTVAEILNAVSFRATEELTYTRSSGIIASTSWSVGSGYAAVNNGAVYMTKPLKTLANYETGKLLIRRESRPGVSNVWYKLGDSTTWTACARVASRTRTPGFIDDEFLVPGGEELRLKIVFSDVTTPIIVDHLSVFPYGTVTVIESIKRPVNTSPLHGAASITSGSVLTGSEFRSLYGEAFKEARFQIATMESFDTTVLDVTPPSGTSFTIPSGTINPGTRYFWRCRYTDAKGAMSQWSEETQFSTGYVFSVISRPACLSPIANSVVGDTDIKLVASQFNIDLGIGSHTATQWQVAVSDTFEDDALLIDSGEDAINLQSKEVNSVHLQSNLLLFWRVRFKAENVLDGWAGWSSWSPVESFIWKEDLVATSVFAPYLYAGNGANQTVVNGVNLLDFGGMSWLKALSAASPHFVFDTESGITKLLPISTSNEQAYTPAVTEVYTSGFGLSGSTMNALGTDYIAYSFRKTAGLFDIVRWTGDGSAGRQVRHDLGATPKLVIAKNVTSPGNTVVFHASCSGNTVFNSKAAQMAGNVFVNGVSTSHLTVAHDLNLSGEGYVAYVFGEIPAISKIGGYTATGSTMVVNCGFYSEPRFVMIKRVDSFGDWYIWDQARGFAAGESDLALTATSDPQISLPNVIDPTASGFTINYVPADPLNILDARYIYMAIA